MLCLFSRGLQLWDWDADLRSMHLLPWWNIHVFRWIFRLHPVCGRHLFVWDWAHCRVHCLPGGDVQFRCWDAHLRIMHLLPWWNIHVFLWIFRMHPVCGGNLFLSLGGAVKRHVHCLRCREVHVLGSVHYLLQL